MTLADVFAALSSPAVRVASNTVSWTEAIGFVTGSLCVWLVAKQHILNWPIGIANNLLFLLLFATSGIYADAGLQVVYVILAVYGWWAWQFGGSNHDALAVTRTDRKTAIGLGVFSASTAAVTWHTPGVNALSVLFVATATGCAGGVVRDLIIDKPTLVLANELYVTPAILGAAALMLAESLGAHPTSALVLAMTLTTTLRMLAIRCDWRLPRIPAIAAAATDK